MHTVDDAKISSVGFGLAKKDYAYLRVVGGKDSVAIRGDTKIFCNDSEERT